MFKALASVLWELLLDGFIMSNGNQHAHQGDVLTNPEFSIFVHEVLFVLFLYEVEGWIVYFNKKRRFEALSKFFFEI